MVLPPTNFVLNAAAGPIANLSSQSANKCSNRHVTINASHTVERLQSVSSPSPKIILLCYSANCHMRELGCDSWRHLENKGGVPIPLELAGTLSRVLEVHDVYTVPTNEMLFLNYSDSSACTSTPPESNRKSCKPVQM